MSRRRPFSAASLLLGFVFVAPAVARDFNINILLTPSAYFGCGDPAYDWIDLGVCDDLASSPNLGPTFAWLVASDSDGFPEGIGGIQFGIEHTVDIADWTICTGGAQISSANWPETGSGNALVWQAGCYEPPAGNARIGFFRLAAGDVGELAVTHDPRIDMTEYTTCSAVSSPVCEANLASLDLSIGAPAHCGAFPGPPPSPATNCTATAEACAIEVRWEHDGADVWGFDLRRDGEHLAFVGGTYFTDYSAEPSVLHTYSATALNGCGAATPSNEASADVVGDVPPATSCTASTTECSQIRVNWEHVGGAEMFKIFRDGSFRSEVNGSRREYIDPGVVRDQSYVYEVVAVGCLDANPSNPATGSAIFPPLVPSDFIVGALGCGVGGIRLEWTDLSLDETGFEIMRGLTPASLELLATVGPDIEEYVDSTTTPGVLYWYRVFAVNSCGPSIGTPITSAAADGVPSTPTECAAASACTFIRVAWADNSVNEDAFEVWRDGDLLTTLGADVTEYEDGDVVLGEPHTYFVIPTNACGDGSASNFATAELEPILGATVLVGPADGLECLSVPVMLSWAPIAGAVEYVVSLGEACGVPDIEYTATGTSLHVDDQGDFFWWVSAVDANGCRSEPSACRSYGTVPLIEAPGFLQETFGGGLGLSRFFWPPVPDAEFYTLRVSDFCKWVDASTTTYTVAGTDTIIDVSAYDGRFEGWVFAIGPCDAVGDSSDCAGPGQPTPVVLESLRATPAGAEIAVEWRTRAESDVRGFHVWRAVDGTDGFRRLNAEVIPASENRTYRFVDDAPVPGTTYDYRLIEETDGGLQIALGEISATASAAPERISLVSAPNPFNPRTTLIFELSEPAAVDLVIYDAAGRVVHRLIRGVPYGAGTHQLVWDGRDDSGASVASGAYFARLRGPSFDLRHRLVLLR